METERKKQKRKKRDKDRKRSEKRLCSAVDEFYEELESAEIAPDSGEKHLVIDQSEQKRHECTDLVPVQKLPEKEDYSFYLDFQEAMADPNVPQKRQEMTDAERERACAEATDALYHSDFVLLMLLSTDDRLRYIHLLRWLEVHYILGSHYMDDSIKTKLRYCICPVDWNAIEWGKKVDACVSMADTQEEKAKLLDNYIWDSVNRCVARKNIIPPSAEKKELEDMMFLYALSYFPDYYRKILDGLYADAVVQDQDTLDTLLFKDNGSTLCVRHMIHNAMHTRSSTSINETIPSPVTDKSGSQRHRSSHYKPVVLGAPRDAHDNQRIPNETSVTTTPTIIRMMFIRAYHNMARIYAPWQTVRTDDIHDAAHARPASQSNDSVWNDYVQQPDSQ
ncbi:MAG: hypothetical protein JSS82_00055 [Bacteroidetes bacterium]|nr:hypothetical protein [Bacteroidota bacterium]